MTFTRLFFVLIAFAFMVIGLMGVYLLVTLAYTSFIDPLFVYPFQDVNERNGAIYPIICIAMGTMAFLFCQEFLRQELDGNRKQFPPTLLGKTVKAMRDNF